MTSPTAGKTDRPETRRSTEHNPEHYSAPSGAAQVPPMRSLSIRQPWAWAIVHGRKDVENRRWPIALGPVAIHASLTFDPAGPDFTPMKQAWALLGMREFPRVVGLMRQGEPHLRVGAIIGVVDIVDVHLVDPVRGCFHEADVIGWVPVDGSDVFDPGWEPHFCSPWGEVPVRAAVGAERPLRHYVLANARPLADPIPFRGHLGVRRLPDGIEEAVRVQVAGYQSTRLDIEVNRSLN